MHDRRLARQKLKEDPHDFEHRLHQAKMGLITYLGKRFLPGGYWSKNRMEEREQAQGLEKKTVLHLTFDDGPSPESTRELLALLEEEEVAACFFFIGENVRRYPELVQATFKAGHIVANHSLSHPFMPALSLPKMEHEIDETNRELEAITGEKPALFRPPFGIIDARCAELLKERRMSPVYWGAVADDWHRVGDDRVAKRIMKQLPKEELIVLHEGAHIGRQNVLATKKIIDKCRDLGYSFDAI